MWILILFFLVGILAGIGIRPHKRLLKTSAIMSEVCVYSLLFILGYLLGVNPQVTSNIFSLGTDAFLLSLCAIVGSILFTLPLGRWIK